MFLSAVVYVSVCLTAVMCVSVSAVVGPSVCSSVRFCLPAVWYMSTCSDVCFCISVSDWNTHTHTTAEQTDLEVVCVSICSAVVCGGVFLCLFAMVHVSVLSAYQFQIAFLCHLTLCEMLGFSWHFTTIYIVKCWVSVDASLPFDIVWYAVFHMVFHYHLTLCEMLF